MVEDDLMYSTLGEVYESDCARHGRDSYEQMSYFKEKLNPATVDRRSPEDVAKLRREIYDNIINLEYVSDRIFTQYMYKILPSCDLLWLFRKEFAVQLALSGFVSCTLQIGGESVDSLAAISWRETVARGPSRAMMSGIPSRTTHLMANESANANPEQLAPMVPLGNGYNFDFFNFNIMTSGGHMSTQIQIPNPKVDITSYPPISC